MNSLKTKLTAKQLRYLRDWYFRTTSKSTNKEKIESYRLFDLLCPNYVCQQDSRDLNQMYVISTLTGEIIDEFDVRTFPLQYVPSVQVLGCRMSLVLVVMEHAKWYNTKEITFLTELPSIARFGVADRNKEKKYGAFDPDFWYKDTQALVRSMFLRGYLVKERRNGCNYYSIIV